MKGLELSKAYWRECGEPILRERCPALLARMAVGLLGHGSECLGFDDELSRDHAWGPGFFVFLNDCDFAQYGERVHAALLSTPAEYKGCPVHRGENPGKGRRSGVFRFRDWLRQKCFIQRIPETPAEWLSIREYELNRATNGEIWHDPLGEVTAIRKHLEAYPEPVWKKRIALKCRQLQNSGPYQVARYLRRNDPVTAGMAVHLFLKQTLQMCFLLRRRYPPFYKWLYRGFLLLPNWSEQMRADLLVLSREVKTEEKLQAIHRILENFRGELAPICPEVSRADLSSPLEGFYTVAKAVNATIEDEALRETDEYELAGAYET